MFDKHICLVLLVCSVSKSSQYQQISPLYNRKELHVNSKDISLVNDTQIKQQVLDLKYLLTDVKLLKELQDSQCLLSFITVALDLKGKEMYAMKMLDAWAKPESGFLLGNIHWDGRYYECLNAEKVINGSIIFSGKYCELESGVTANGTAQLGYAPGITFAICVPDTCSAENLTEALNKLSRFMKSKTAYVAKCLGKAHQWTTADTIAIIVIVIFLSLATLGTFIPLLWTRLPRSASVVFEPDEDESLLDAENKTPFPMWLQLLECFSLVRNSSMILDTDKKEGNINCLHGLRVISIMWIILGHTFLFVFPVLDNVSTMADYISEHGSFMFVINGMFAVDTFFFIGGLLVVFLGMRHMTKKNGSINIPMMYLVRYLRLTPVYAFVILFSVSLFKYLGDGPNFISAGEYYTQSCPDNWWSNLLYISNFYPVGFGAECIPWSWYLANDMQFYILSPFFLILLYRRYRVGVISLVTGVFISMAITCAMAAYYGLQPWDLVFSMIVRAIKGQPSVPPYVPTGNATGSNADILASDLYGMPWYRIGVYFIGMLTGYHLHNADGRMQMKKIVVLLGWLCSAVTILSLMYSNYNYLHTGDFMSLSLAVFYSTISRPLWALALYWIVMACHHGYGGLVNRFLSAGIWIPFSRMTYGAYLVHPLIIYIFLTNSEVNVHFSITIITCYYLATLALSFGVSYILTMIIEKPITGIIQTLQKEK